MSSVQHQRKFGNQSFGFECASFFLQIPFSASGGLPNPRFVAQTRRIGEPSVQKIQRTQPADLAICLERVGILRCKKMTHTLWIFEHARSQVRKKAAGIRSRPASNLQRPRRILAVCPEVEEGAKIEVVVTLWNSMSPFWQPVRVWNGVYAATAPREMRNSHKTATAKLSISKLYSEQKTGGSRSFRSKAV